MRLTLYQPDKPQSVGAVARICACFAVPLDIIEPCGFPLGDKALRRVAMDYLDKVTITRHASWEQYCQSSQTGRLILLTTKARLIYTDFHFTDGDRLLLGRESAGVPSEVHETADATVRIPLADGLRSLNIAVAGGIVLAEALRQRRQNQERKMPS